MEKRLFHLRWKYIEKYVENISIQCKINNHFSFFPIYQLKDMLSISLMIILGLSMKAPITISERTTRLDK